ncbi:MAG: hypothetical protein IIX16_01840 [Clostridia bacterium]|nr:hypothetical protein [Clostridia bacterium]
MTERNFFRILIAVIAVCAVLTVAHLIYDFYAYQHCSIIYFIAKELW